VLLVDDKPSICRFAVKALGQAGYEVEAAHSIAAAKDLLDGPFDVAVLDVELPDGNGFQLVELLRSHYSVVVPVVMITGNPDPDKVSNTIRYGITEFLFKPFGRAELQDAVQRALDAGLRWKERIESAQLAVSQGAEPPPSEDGVGLAPGDVPPHLIESLSNKHGLTDREAEILELVLAGLQNADIAERLNISANTVKYHVRNVFTKLGVESRVQLFRQLIQPGD
jgi:DNA-binding NarL/FixJ family response regulator